MTLNEKNWLLVKAINKELNIFQDREVISDGEKKLRQKESVEKSNTDKYECVYSVRL